MAGFGPRSEERILRGIGVAASDAARRPAKYQRDVRHFLYFPGLLKLPATRDRQGIPLGSHDESELYLVRRDEEALHGDC